jgi:hypothetical protein
MAAILFSNFVWEGKAIEMLEDLPGLHDGQIYKQIDTGESFFRRDGSWEFINLGLAFIKATKSGSAVTDSTGKVDITFTTPFIDQDYSVMLGIDDPGTGQGIIAYSSSRTPTGFRIIARRPTSGQPQAGIPVNWLCTRDYDP